MMVRFGQGIIIQSKGGMGLIRGGIHSEGSRLEEGTRNQRTTQLERTVCVCVCECMCVRVLE